MAIGSMAIGSMTTDPMTNGPMIKTWRISLAIQALARTVALVATLALATIPNALADCVFPKAPEQVPDGKTASESEMISAMTVFKQYNADVTAYSACLEKETAEKIRDAGGATSAIIQIKSLQAKKNNVAVDELQKKATDFNEQVRIFKARK